MSATGTEATYGPRARGVTLLSAQTLAGSLTVAAAALSCLVSGEFGPGFGVAFFLSLAAAHWLGARVAHRFNIAWTTLLAAALVLLGLRVAGGTLDIVLGAAWFALLLTTHRLWNRTTERDELLLLLLSLLLLCAGAALSAELLFGFAFAAYAVAGTWALALTHLKFRIEAAKGPEAEALLRSKRLVSPALLGALGGLSLLGLIGATVVFFVFPRVTIGGMRRASRGTPRAGLSEQVDLRGHGTLADDPRVVLRARFDPDPGTSEIELHWRARALEVWTGQGWRARSQDRGDARMGWFKPKLLRGRRVWSSVDVEAVAGFSEGVILVPEGWPEEVRFPRPLTARPVETRLMRDMAGDLFYAPVEVGDLNYIVTWQPLASAAELLAKSGPLPDELPRSASFNLEVPDTLDPRIRALGERLARGKTPYAAAESVRTWLESSYAYTRELAGDQDDPIAHFLFERKKGHCELFSSAMVLILRSAGIPARNVTGYYGGVRTRSGYYAVRAGDAHSWVEVFIPGFGFVPFDPTPASERGSQQDGLWADAILLWDGLAARWRSLVVDFDLVQQGRVVQELGTLLRDATRRLSGRGTGGAPQLSGPLFGLGVAAALVVLLLVVRRQLRLRRRTSAADPLTDDQLRAQALLRKARLRLAKAGLTLPGPATARELEAQVRTQLPHLAPTVSLLVSRCANSRWGGSPLPSAMAKALLRSLDSAAGTPPASGSR